ncbi:MAG: chorismate-binding protein [Planctomycetota bacterium]
MTSDPPPFGPPAIATSPQITRLRRQAVGDPLTVLALMRARGLCGAGFVLLESLGPDLPTTRRSVLVPRPVLRIEARDGVVRASALVPGGEPMLDALQARLPGAQRDCACVTAQFAASIPSPDQPDDVRLRLPSILDAVRAVAGLVADRDADAQGARPPALPPGVFGVLAYDLVDQLEILPPRQAGDSTAADPDFTFVLGTDYVLWQHQEQECEVVTRGLPWERTTEVAARHRAQVDALRVEAGSADREAEPAPTRHAPAPAVPEVSDAAFLQGVETFRTHVFAGDIFQGVLSRGLTMTSDAPALATYRALRTTNPSPYMFCFDLGGDAGDGTLLGASPEAFLRVEDGEVEIRPIAGTAPRGRAPDGSIDADLDARLALGMLLDPKEQAEHAMLLDLARNDVARVARAGTCRVVQQFAFEKYSHVQHLVSRVRGALRPGLDALHAYRAAANMGTLTGAPKLEAMRLIRLNEPSPRGFYGGAAGYVLQDGRMDTCIVIRALRQRGSMYHTRVGAGVMAASVPARELAEIEAKAMACRVAVANAEGERT